jgi:hypothetical protein
LATNSWYGIVVFGNIGFNIFVRFDGFIVAFN